MAIESKELSRVSMRLNVVVFSEMYLQKIEKRLAWLELFTDLVLLSFASPHEVAKRGSTPVVGRL